MSCVRKREEEFENHNNVMRLDESEPETDSAYFGMHIVIEEPSDDENYERLYSEERSKE